MAEDDLAERQQRALAVRLFNETWQRLEATPPDPQALQTAMASRLHWDGIGETEQLAVGDWLIAHVASRLGYSNLALDYASTAHERAVSGQVPLWLVASVQEGMSRAHAAAGHDEERDRWAANARQTLAAVDDDEDRELIEGQLASIPGLTP
jgi:hypothetical protein